MKLYKKLLLGCTSMFLIPAATFAVTVTGSLSCNGYTFTSIPSSSSCTGTGITVSASADLSVLNMSATVTNPNPSLNGSGTLGEQFTITADAPSQAGFLVLSGNVSGTQNTLYSLGYAQVVVTGPQVDEFLFSTGANNFSVTLPVQLGQTFNVSLATMLTINPEPTTNQLFVGTTGAYANLSYQFETANGTPVGAIVDAGAAPEPGTMSLLGCALGAGLIWARKRK